jgi:RsiW-degrading membrane proteinase PrsW (M82 family)
VILYAAIVICGALASLLVYHYDLYEREPWPGLLATAVLGALVMRVAYLAELFVLTRYGGDAAAAATAAVAEELFRLICVAAVAGLFPGTFNDPMDGIVYGSILGVGMGAEESFALIASAPPSGLERLPHELVRLLGHLVMGGITGFGVGLGRMRVAAWPRALTGAVMASVALHFLWDLVALHVPVTVLGVVLQNLAGIAVMLSGMLLYGFLVTIAAERSRCIFAPASVKTLWGWPFALARGEIPRHGDTRRP